MTPEAPRDIDTIIVVLGTLAVAIGIVLVTIIITMLRP